MLKHYAGLHDEAAIGDLDGHLLPVAEPDKEAGEARFAMDGEEVEIVVEAGKRGTDFEFLEVGGSWGQKVVTLPHPISKSICLKSHALSCHLDRNFSRIYHEVSPRVHILLPLRKAIWKHLWDVILNLSWAVADSPEETPFCVEFWWEGTHRHVFCIEPLHYLGVVTRPFRRRWRDTRLVTEVGATVLQFFACVESLTDLFKVLLNHVDKRVIVVVVHAGVSHHKDTKLVEALCHLFAFSFPSFTLVQVDLNVDDGDLGWFGFLHGV